MSVASVLSGEPQTCPANFRQSGRVATLRGSTSAGGGSGATPNRVEVALSTAGVRTFACSVSDHCESGQIVAVYTDVRPGGVEQSSGAGRGAAGLLVLAAALVQTLCVV